MTPKFCLTQMNMHRHTLQAYARIHTVMNFTHRIQGGHTFKLAHAHTNTDIWKSLMSVINGRAALWDTRLCLCLSAPSSVEIHHLRPACSFPHTRANQHFKPPTPCFIVNMIPPIVHGQMLRTTDFGLKMYQLIFFDVTYCGNLVYYVRELRCSVYNVVSAVCHEGHC